MIKLSSQTYWLILLIVVGSISFLNRWIFVYNFEPEYWENYYYESQWNVPNSKRVISDEGVYRYIGYRLVNGENPFNVDYWVPPLGKYIYGFSAKFFHNPYFASFLFYLLSLVVFRLLAKTLIKPKKIQWLTLFLFAINPLLIEQMQQTMLDLPLTIFFMLSIYFLFRSEKDKSLKSIVFSGISLGLMAGTKPAYFVPMIALLSLYYLYKTNKFTKWRFYLPSIVIGYVLSYFCYFLKHPNPIPWIRLHQKIIDFQKNNSGSHDWFNIFRVIFLNKYKGFWLGAKTIKPLNWSVILPAGTIGLVYPFFAKNKQNHKIIYLSVLGILYIAMNLFIDFWPRYLMPLIPILILVLGHILKNKSKLIILLLSTSLISLFPLLFPNSLSAEKIFAEKHQYGFYKETYQLLDSQTKQKIDYQQWQQLSLNPNINKQLKPVKENNQWKFNLQAKTP